MPGGDDYSEPKSETTATEETIHLKDQRLPTYKREGVSNSERANECESDGSKRTTPAGAGEQSHPMRRRSLLRSLAGAALAGAGGAAMDGPITPASAESDESGGTSKTKDITFGLPVTINPRLVQTVGNTRVVKNEEVIHRVPDPDLVANKRGAVLFDLELDGMTKEDTTAEEIVETLPDEIPYKVTTNRNGTKETHDATIPGFFIAEMLMQDDFSLVNAAGNGWDVIISDIVPEFVVDKDLDSVTIELAPEQDILQADPVTFGGDGDEDPEMPAIHEPKTLRIGFIPFIATNNDAASIRSVDRMRKVARLTVDYLEAAYPVSDVEAVVYRKGLARRLQEPEDEKGPGTKGIRGKDLDASPGPRDEWMRQSDGRTARERLLSRARAGKLRESNADVDIISGDGPIEDLDHVIMHVGEEYFPEGVLGLDQGMKDVASIIATPPSLDDHYIANTVAHELTHYFLWEVYEDTPLVGHREDEDSGELLAEPVHAAPLRSEADKKVRVDAYGFKPSTPGGNWDSGFVAEPGVYSLMSYGSPGWPDSLMYQKLLESGLTPGGQKAANQELSGEAYDMAFDGIANLGDEDPQVRGTLQQDARVASQGSSDDADTAETIQFEVIGMADEVLEARSESSQAKPRAQIRDFGGNSSPSTETLSGVALFSLPFPEEAKEVRISHEGTAITVQPLAINLRDLARRLPAEAFDGESSLTALSTGGGEAGREALVDAAQRMGDALNQGAYSAAADILDSEITPLVQNLNADYSGALNVPDYDGLQAMVDTTRERVRRFADELEDSEMTADDLEGGSGGGGAISTERTSLHEKGGGPC